MASRAQSPICGNHGQWLPPQLSDKQRWKSHRQLFRPYWGSLLGQGWNGCLWLFLLCLSARIDWWEHHTKNWLTSAAGKSLVRCSLTPSWLDGINGQRKRFGYVRLAIHTIDSVIWLSHQISNSVYTLTRMLLRLRLYCIYRTVASLAA